MVASSIVIPIISLSTLPIQSMSLTFLHPSPNGNSLVRPGITLALGESFGLIIQLSLPFPREVRSTPIVPTLLLSRNYLNTFKRRSLKYLTAIGTALFFIKPSLLLSSTATKQYAGSLPITLIDSFRSVLLHPFSCPSATTKQEFLRYLTTLLVVLPQPLNLHSRLLRAKPHPIATTTSKKTAANGPHILLTLNVGPRLPIANVTSLLCRSPLPLRLKLLLPSLLPNHGCQRLLWLRRRFRLLNPIPPRKSPTVLPETAAPSHLPSASSAPPPPPRRLMLELTSTPFNCPFRTFVVLMNYRPIPTLVHTAQNSGDMAPSNTTSFSLPTRTIRSPLPIFLSHPMRSRITFSATFLH